MFNQIFHYIKLILKIFWKIKFTLILIVISYTFYNFEFTVSNFAENYLMVPSRVLEAPEIIITSMFMHKDISHLSNNILSLYAYGIVLEPFLGSMRYLSVFLICGVGATFVYLFVALISHIAINYLSFGVFSEDLWVGYSCGLSGAIFGLLVIFSIFASHYLFYNIDFILLKKGKSINYLQKSAEYQKIVSALIGTSFLIILSYFSGSFDVQVNAGGYAHMGGILTGLLVFKIGLNSDFKKISKIDMKEILKSLN